MIEDSFSQQRLIEQFSFLRDGEPRLREAFFAQASQARLPAEHIICHDGGHCSHLPLILSGRARIYKLGENGREITLYRIGPGESCVLTASCILSGRPFPAFAVCETAIEAVVVSHTSVHQWMTLYAIWRELVFTLVADRLGEVLSVLDSVLFRPLDQRLAALLLHRSRAMPASGPSPSRILKTTHQALAADLGSSREVVTRVLKDFETTGALITGRGQIELIDPSRLEARLRPSENH